MQKADTNRRFPARGIAGGSIAGFRILRDIFIEFLQEFESLFLAPELHKSGNLRISRTGTLRVGSLDFVLVFRVSQILPALRHRQIQLLQAFRIHTKTENTQINC